MPTTILSIADTNIKARWRAPYASSELNLMNVGSIPNGVVRGGRLTVSGGNDAIVVSSDGGESIYIFKATNGFQTTIRITGDVSLDLSGVVGTAFYVCVYVNYTTGATTTAEYRTVSAAELAADPSLVVIGYVDLTGHAGGIPIPASLITPEGRTEAWINKAKGTRDWTQVVSNGSFLEGSKGSSTEGRLSNQAHVPGMHTKILSGGSTIDISDEEARTGTHALRITGAAVCEALLAGYIGEGNNQLGVSGIPVKSGQFIHVSFWVKGSAWTGPASPGDQSMLLSFETGRVPDLLGSANQVTVDLTLADHNGTFDWVKVESIFEAPITGFMSWGFRAFHAAASGKLFVDDIRIWLEAGNYEDDLGVSNALAGTGEFAADLITLLPNTGTTETDAQAGERSVNLEVRNSSGSTSYVEASRPDGQEVQFEADDFLAKTVQAATFADGTTVNAGSLVSKFDDVIAQLGGSNGEDKIGASAKNIGPYSVPTGRLDQQISDILTQMDRTNQRFHIGSAITKQVHYFTNASYYKDVAYSYDWGAGVHNKFVVAVGTGGIIDGYREEYSTLFSRTKPADITTLNGVTVKNGDKWVAVGDAANNNTICYSTDAEATTWLSAAANSSNTLRAVIWIEDLNLFVTCGSGGVIETSPDGINWTSRVSGSANTLHDITWSSSLQLAVIVGANNTILTSSDCITWTARVSPLNPTDDIGTIAYNEQTVSFVAGVNIYINNECWIIRSDDGLNWDLVQVNDLVDAGGDENSVVGSVHGAFVVAHDWRLHVSVDGGHTWHDCGLTTEDGVNPANGALYYQYNDSRIVWTPNSNHVYFAAENGVWMSAAIPTSFTDPDTNV